MRLWQSRYSYFVAETVFTPFRETLRLRHCPCEHLLYFTFEGVLDRKPKGRDLPPDRDGEARALARRLEAELPNILVRKQFLHLGQGFLNRSVRCMIVTRTMHSRLYGLLLLSYATTFIVLSCIVFLR
jgi:hypothetical protein